MPNQTLRRAALFMLVTGPVGWLFFYFLFRPTMGQDWMVFDTAVQAWARGDTALLLDGPRFTAVLNATHAAYLQKPLVFHPWVYPPYTLLLVVPLAALGWPATYITFQAASFTMMAAALRLWQPPGAARWVMLAGVTLCPATAFTLGAGQNSFFSAGLVLAGFACLDRRPRLAGLCIGLLAFKPQLALLVPVAVAAAGAWTAFFAAGATVAALLLVSLAVPGVPLWRGWLQLFLSGDPAFHQWVEQGRIYGQSVFTHLRLLGLPNAAANIGQDLATLAAGICVWVAYRGGLTPARALAVLLVAMTLGAPHLGDYDTILCGVAAMLVLVESRTAPLARGAAVLAALVWAATAINPPLLFHTATITPILEFAFILRLILTPTPGLTVSVPNPRNVS